MRPGSDWHDLNALFVGRSDAHQPIIEPVRQTCGNFRRMMCAQIVCASEYHGISNE